ncbi:MAG: hypothetical protein WCA91_04900 [Candidatus Acidiferrales bacterium]
MDDKKSNAKPADPRVWDKPRRSIIATVPIYKKPVSKSDEKIEVGAFFNQSSASPEFCFGSSEGSESGLHDRRFKDERVAVELPFRRKDKVAAFP